VQAANIDKHTRVVNAYQAAILSLQYNQQLVGGREEEVVGASGGVTKSTRKNLVLESAN